jgi:RNA methyltransferase, TrmH family
VPVWASGFESRIPHNDLKHMITSTQNSLVKLFRKLQVSKHRREMSVLFLEGSNLVDEAVQADRTFEVFCCTESWRDRHSALFDQSVNRSDRFELVSDDVLKAMAMTVNPEGVVASCGKPATTEVKIQSFGLVLDRIQDPGNLGTMIRTAVAAGVEGLWVSGDSADLDHPKVMRSSAGQWFRLPMQQVNDLEHRLRQAQDQGMQIVTTLPKAEKSLWDVDLTRPTLVVLGNEGAGLPMEMAEMADVPIRIPLMNGVESLNVAIAAAIVMYEVQRQRCSPTDCRSSGLC